MTPSRAQYFYASAWPWVITFWGLPLACAASLGLASGASEFLSAIPLTLFGAFWGFVAAAFIIGPGQQWRGEVNGPFDVGDRARILVRPHRDRVARVCEVWPERQTARLDVGEPVGRYGEDTFAWYQLARERVAEPAGAQLFPRMRASSEVVDRW